jgi:hypothetical protein
MGLVDTLCYRGKMEWDFVDTGYYRVTMERRSVDTLCYKGKMEWDFVDTGYYRVTMERGSVGTLCYRDKQCIPTHLISESVQKPS